MKRLAVLFLCLTIVISALFFFLGRLSIVDGQSVVSAGEIAGTETVWIPRTGTKYHSHPTCSNMKDPTRTSRREAERHGYGPCKTCYG